MSNLSSNAERILEYLYDEKNPVNRTQDVLSVGLGLGRAECALALEELLQSHLIESDDRWFNVTSSGADWVIRARRSPTTNITVEGNVGPGAVVGSGSVAADIIAGRDVTADLKAEHKEPSAIHLSRYLERLQSFILESFRQDHFVMMTVESLESEDPNTFYALQRALRSAFDIQVEQDRVGGSSQPLEEAVSDFRLVALLGDPGIGKTTSLRYLALRQIERVRTGANQLIPVWISLGKWADKETSAEEFLWHEFRELLEGESVTQDTFETWIEQGRVILFLDGLNELPQRELEQSGANISQPDSLKEASDKRRFDPRENNLLVLARETESRFLLSCRILEYTHLPGWREFRVLPLTDELIAEFVQRHLADRSQRFFEILEKQPDLQDFMRNPFFLRSLVRLVQEDWQQEPTDRFQVVKYTCQAGLHREAQRRGLDAEEVANLLGTESLDAIVNGWIGSWFSTLIKLSPETAEDETSQQLPLIDAMRCAEGAGLGSVDISA